MLLRHSSPASISGTCHVEGSEPATDGPRHDNRSVFAGLGATLSGDGLLLVPGQDWRQVREEGARGEEESEIKQMHCGVHCAGREKGEKAQAQERLGLSRLCSNKGD